jgi:hypothetical protein
LPSFEDPNLFSPPSDQGGGSASTEELTLFARRELLDPSSHPNPRPFISLCCIFAPRFAVVVSSDESWYWWYHSPFAHPILVRHSHGDSSGLNLQTCLRANSLVCHCHLVCQGPGGWAVASVAANLLISSPAILESPDLDPPPLPRYIRDLYLKIVFSSSLVVPPCRRPSPPWESFGTWSSL